MKRKKRHPKNMNLKNKFLKNPVIKGLMDKFVTTITIMLISWAIGFLSNYLPSSKTISQLKIDNANLEWGVDYFRTK